MSETKIQIPDQEHEEVPDFLKNLGWFGTPTKPRRLNPKKPRERDTYSLEYRGTAFAPLGGVHALTGQSGHGKTMTLTLLMATILGANVGGELRCCLPEGMKRKVLYIDTEMEEMNTMKVHDRVCNMMGWQLNVEHDEFAVMMLREEESVEERWKTTLQVIYEERPTAVFIDGLLDLVSDFNKNDLCQELIYQCMKIASHYGTSLWCLVHENPGSTKMVGHLGSMLSRKVTDLFCTQKKKDGGIVTFIVKQEKARGKDVDDIVFTVVDGLLNLGEPHIIEAGEAMAPQQQEGDLPAGHDWAKLMREVISCQYGITTKELTNEIKNRMHVGYTKATQIIDTLEAQNIIRRESRGREKRYYISDGAITNDMFKTRDGSAF